jgi:hypothetical protein
MRKVIPLLLLVSLTMFWVELPDKETRHTQRRAPMATAPARAASLSVPASSPGTAVPKVSLQAGSGATIPFKAENGEAINSIPPQTTDLPHLVLYRNGALADATERTLTVVLREIAVPPAGVRITVELETQHGNPDLGGNLTTRIPVWHGSRWISNTVGVTRTGVTAVLAHEFTGTVISGTEMIATPTDYFRYHIVLTDMINPLAEPLYTFEEEYAFLMESQWVAQLPEVLEASQGAAPDELLVYYCDMFPIRKEKRDPSSWVPRAGVTDYVQGKLVPAMVEAFRMQSDEWRFPWYAAWTSHRTGGDSDRLSVALAKGGTWYHGRAPSNGNSGISLRVDGGGFSEDYDTLTDALISVFHHELFHNFQKSILQRGGDDQDVNGERGVWAFILEGTAVVAASVGQSSVEFGQSSGARHYMDNANRFLGTLGLAAGELNRSYENMSPYHAAIYWRFLYEQYGGMGNGVKDPAAGMDVIRRALLALSSKDVAGSGAPTAFVLATPALMDEVLKDSLCPFKTHRESLIAFARAIYALRLEGGRCVVPGIPAGCGFYDPHHLYHDPPVAKIPYAGGEISFSAADQLDPAGIKSSFGMDFVEVVLNPALDGKSLTLEFSGAPGAAAEFNVQLWRLGPGGGKPRAVSAAPEPMARNTEGGYVYTIARVDTVGFNRLALIITRLDPHEARDSVGSYTIRLESH